MKRRLVILSTCCLVLVFLMTSLAIAQNAKKGPSGPPGVSAEGVIFGCFKKVNGQLRVVSGPGQCLPSETSIFWNKVGPQGPQGPVGPQGPPGPPPTLRITHQASGVTLKVPGEVLSLPVPAGSYAISAKVTVINLDNIHQVAFCFLSTGDSSGVVLGPAGDDSAQVISLLDAATFTSTSDKTITLTCDTTNGEATNGVLSAIEVEIAPPPEPK